VHSAPCRVDPVGELAQHLAPLGHEVVAARPRRPHAVRGDVHTRSGGTWRLASSS
jgi:hypothetical protein